MPKASVNYALAATLVASGATFAEAAPQSGAKSGESLRIGLLKRGVTARVARQLEPTGDKRRSVTLQLATEAGLILAERAEQLKQRLSTELSNQVALLEKHPAKTVKELQQGRTQTVKQLIESANALAPEASTSPAPIMMLFMDQSEATEALEVESSVSQTEPNQASPDQPSSDAVQEQGQP